MSYLQKKCHECMFCILSVSLVIIQSQVVYLDSLPHSVFHFLLPISVSWNKENRKMWTIIIEKTNLIYTVSPEIILEYK